MLFNRTNSEISEISKAQHRREELARILGTATIPASIRIVEAEADQTATIIPFPDTMPEEPPVENDQHGEAPPAQQGRSSVVNDLQSF